MYSVLLGGLYIVLAAASQSVPKTDDWTTAGQNGTIGLFPFATSGQQGGQLCPSDTPAETISLAPETCLSGDFPIFNNTRIDEAPVCSDGQAPVLVVYHHRGCTYPADYHVNLKGHAIPFGCLRPVKSHYWSLIFRCGIWGPLESGGRGYIDAVLPGAPRSGGKSMPGKIETHLSFDCGARRVGGRRPTELPVDRCMRNLPLSIQILRPPVCANGTRAMWARFPGDRCNEGKVAANVGLVDIEDSDIGKCINVFRLNARNKDEESINSMSFWCDGFGDRDPWPKKEKEEEEEKPKTKAGSVSDNNCWTKDGPKRASTWMHPAADTCWGLRPHAQMYLYSNAVCENGTQARLAKYEGKGCEGEPSELKEVGDGMLRTCLPEKDYPSDNSYAFWCAGEIKKDPSRRPGAPSEGSGSSKTNTAIVVVGIVLFVLAFMCLVLCTAARRLILLFQQIKGALWKRDGAIRLA